MTMQDQTAIFQARVKNINNPRNNYYLDPETGMKIPKRVGRNQISANGKTPPATSFGLIMGMILGVLCLMVARYLQIAFLDIKPSVPNALAVELAMSGVLAFTIGGFVRQKTFKHMIAQMAGAALAAVTMHNAVWVAPDQFAMVFSQDFVDQILAATDPMSLNIAGNSITI
jgi:hypothetical protein